MKTQGRGTVSETMRKQAQQYLKNVIGVNEVADILGISARRVRVLAEDRLEGRKVGHDFVFYKPFIQSYRSVPRPRGRPPVVR